MIPQTTITLVVIAVVLILVITGIVTLIKMNSAEARDKKLRQKSTRIRGEVEQQAKEIKQRCEEDAISFETEAGKELKKALDNCDYLIRDGYRSTDTIEKVSAKLPELEQEARLASGVK